jgi:hypothetical protein
MVTANEVRKETCMAPRGVLSRTIFLLLEQFDGMWVEAHNTINDLLQKYNVDEQARHEVSRVLLKVHTQFRSVLLTKINKAIELLEQAS